jgi:hypothetical protein
MLVKEFLLAQLHIHYLDCVCDAESRNVSASIIRNRCSPRGHRSQEWLLLFFRKRLMEELPGAVGNRKFNIQNTKAREIPKSKG